MNADRAHAVSCLLPALKLVGPHEAAWALKIALHAIEKLPAGADHIAAISEALEAEMNQPAAAELQDPEAPAPDAPAPDDQGQQRSGKKSS
jgi:hypothetical protein